jgi:hypothetical protein
MTSANVVLKKSLCPCIFIFFKINGFKDTYQDTSKRSVFLKKYYFTSITIIDLGGTFRLTILFFIFRSVKTAGLTSSGFSKVL